MTKVIIVDGMDNKMFTVELNDDYVCMLGRKDLIKDNYDYKFHSDGTHTKTHAGFKMSWKDLRAFADQVDVF